MATIDFTCQKCEGNFELDAQDLIDGTEKLECPHCENKLSKTANEDFSAAIAELHAQLASIAKKFTASLEIESEDVAAADLDDEDDDDEEEDDDLDDDEDDDDDDDLEEDDIEEEEN